MQSDLFESFFEDAVRRIIAHITNLLDSLLAQAMAVNVLVMVGGFSDSEILQKEIRKAFSNRVGIVIPPEASLCVLKGAVLFGFEPERITERVSRFTFGIEQSVNFDPLVHPDSRKTQVNGKMMVDGVFDIHVRIGDTVKYGLFQSERIYYPMSPNDLQYYVTLYRSTKKDPRFTDEDGCDRVTCFYMNRPFQVGTPIRDEEIKIRLAFGHSDVVAEVTARDGTRINSECIL